ASVPAIVSQRKGQEPSGTAKSRLSRICSSTTPAADSRTAKCARSEAAVSSANLVMLDSKRMAERDDGWVGSVSCDGPGWSVVLFMAFSPSSDFVVGGGADLKSF